MSDLIGGLKTAMHALSDRQKVIAQNIANSETPGFRARETKAPDFAGLLGSGGIGTVTRPTVRISSGMAALGARQPMGGTIVSDPDTGEAKPDGNNVVLEEQLMKLGQIQSDYATVTLLYKKQMGLLRTAASKGGF